MIDINSVPQSQEGGNEILVPMNTLRSQILSSEHYFTLKKRYHCSLCLILPIPIFINSIFSELWVYVTVKYLGNLRHLQINFFITDLFFALCTFSTSLYFCKMALFPFFFHYPFSSYHKSFNAFPSTYLIQPIFAIKIDISLNKAKITSDLNNSLVMHHPTSFPDNSHFTLKMATMSDV